MIIVDSNVFIFGEVGNAPENKAAIAKIRDVLMQGEIGINAIIVSEVFHKLQVFFGRAEAEARVSRIVSDPDVRFGQFSAETALRAMKLARDFQMRINDAMIAQQAMETGSAVLTDNVKDFGKIKALKIIVLRG